MSTTGTVPTRIICDSTGSRGLKSRRPLLTPVGSANPPTAVWVRPAVRTSELQHGAGSWW